ncbi:hypothetical protein SLEP1_g53341 [Rubroshorea leprosula]|uniref:Thaumatin-like protein n=1 Tax=Rubroshorea leprosula TaxID=152421 RepID=A0AAV5M942_9ROSI|nr:hypothetical protein SLEP1_g53341 [Rubroshorea leprosula]
MNQNNDPSTGEFSAERGSGVEEILSTPDKLTGSIWLWTGCSYDSFFNFTFTCETGDCGAGVDCQGPSSTYPPVGGTSVGGSRPCPVADCARNIGDVCPAPLVATNKNGAYVGCNSACDALKDPQSCCTGDFAEAACQPNDYSKRFKDLCNMAHTYPGDSNPPVYKCSGATSYTIRFCP